MIEVPQHPDYDKNSCKATSDDYPCVVCGKPVKAGKGHSVYLGKGGSHLLLESEADPAASDFLGVYPLGRDCLRNNPQLRPYVLQPAA